MNPQDNYADIIVVEIIESWLQFSDRWIKNIDASSNDILVISQAGENIMEHHLHQGNSSYWWCKLEVTNMKKTSMNTRKKGK